MSNLAHRALRFASRRAARRALRLAPLLLVACIDNLSVGLSPSLTARDAGNESPSEDDDTSDHDSGSVPVDAGNGRLDASRDAASDASDTRVDASPEGGSDAAAVDAGRDAGRRRCDTSSCAIAGITPMDSICIRPTVQECLWDEAMGQCSWFCL